MRGIRPVGREGQDPTIVGDNMLEKRQREGEKTLGGEALIGPVSLRVRCINNALRCVRQS